MNVSRAKEIINSPNSVEVLYNNIKVWLENVDEAKEVVYVKNLGNNEKIEVPVECLNETGNMLKM